MEWVQARIPSEMMEEIREIIKRKKLWVNEHEFIRDAVREKLSTLVSDALLHYINSVEGQAPESK